MNFLLFFKKKQPNVPDSFNYISAVNEDQNLINSSPSFLLLVSIFLFSSWGWTWETWLGAKGHILFIMSCRGTEDWTTSQLNTSKARCSNLPSHHIPKYLMNCNWHSLTHSKDTQQRPSPADTRMMSPACVVTGVSSGSGLHTQFLDTCWRRLSACHSFAAV